MNDLDFTYEEWEGKIERVVFRNDENGWTVCEFSTDDEDFTAVGVMFEAAQGDRLKIQGNFIEHPTYGRQFKIESCEKIMPVDEDGIYNYLASGSIKGIGPAMAQKIVDKFGGEVFEVMEKEPERLSEIKGVSKKKALQIGELFNAQFGMRVVLVFLNKYGISPSLSVKIWRKWGSVSVDIIKANPYILSDEIDGVDFEKCEKIANAMGIERSFKFRIRAGIIHILKHNLSNGHTFLPVEKLTETAVQLLAVEKSDVEQALQDSFDNESLVNKQTGKYNAVYLKQYYDAETYIARRITEMANTAGCDENLVEEEIKKIQAELNISYADLQNKAIKAAAASDVMLLTGGPGTGKTTTVNGIIKLFDALGFNVALTAPTGRAAKRMTEITGCEAKTIHRLLEYNFGEGDVPVFMRDEKKPLKADVVIADEMSMVDVLLMESLLKGLKRGAKLIMVGDFDQLPPVGAGSVFKDLILSKVLPVVHLTEIFRQAAQSLIVVNAHRINTGQLPVLDNRKSDFIFMRRTTSNSVIQTVVELAAERLPASLKYSPMNDIQVIAPSKIGDTGTRSLNYELQNALNPPSVMKHEKKLRDFILREGDKVMQVRNNYDIDWERPDGTYGTGVFNGELGIVERISSTSQESVIRFDDKKIIYDFSMLDDIDHAFAITVHKSQGSEFPAIILPLFSGSDFLFHRNLLYTAVTRARELVVIVGLETLVYKMTENLRFTRRYTGLLEFVKYGI